VHPAGGTVLCYADLAAALGLDQPFYGIQEFGLEEGHTPLSRIEDMAALYVKEIREIQPQGPYRLAGWSFGGLAAFEVAQQLQAAGQQVATLVMFDAYAPDSLSTKLQDVDDVDHIMSLFGDDVDLSEEYLRQLNPDDRLTHVLAKAKEVDLVPPSFTLDQTRRLMQVFTINSKAVHAYQPRTYDGQVTLFAAREKTEAVVTVTSTDETHGWSALAKGGVTLHWVEGNHHAMLSKPYVQALGNQLRICIDGTEIQKGRKMA
jgi:thioesterase domain-containing protein